MSVIDLTAQQLDFSYTLLIFARTLTVSTWSQSNCLSIVQIYDISPEINGSNRNISTNTFLSLRGLNNTFLSQKNIGLKEKSILVKAYVIRKGILKYDIFVHDLSMYSKFYRGLEIM